MSPRRLSFRGSPLGHYHGEPVPDDGPASKISTLRVLIVDDVAKRSAGLRQALRASSVASVVALSLEVALEQLRTEHFDVVVCDLRMGGGAGAALAEWIGRSASSMRMVAVGPPDPAFRERFGAQSFLRVHENAEEQRAIAELLCSLGPRRGFFGNSIEIELFDYVQMIALTGRDKHCQ